MHGILTRYNADSSDIFTAVGWETAAAVDLLDEERWLLNDLRDDLRQAENRLDLVDDRLMRFAARAPLKEREARAVLVTMPGVGTVTIDVLLAELGDWERFRSADTVVAFAGLDPGVRESDGQRKDLRLTKAGSPLLRWILIQLAHRVKRTSARWKTLFDRLSERCGKKKATCAIARRLLLVIYAMLREGKAYHYPAAA